MSNPFKTPLSSNHRTQSPRAYHSPPDTACYNWASPSESQGRLFTGTSVATPPAVRTLSRDDSLRSEASEGSGGKPRSNVKVAVRFRPLSDKEGGRGDQEVWGWDGQKSVGLMVSGTCKPRYTYDTVYGATAINEQVYSGLAAPGILPTLQGYNATIFAYGVTSSGKTHTMMGGPTDPGIVPRAIRHVFECQSQLPDKLFRIRLSMMEIYNEVLNDLLDPSKQNLKVQDAGSRKGTVVMVEGLTEALVVSAEQALALIATGDANRKVSATAYNEDSSRSHTICRLTVEGHDREGGGRGTVSYLHLIDLAGSESARATVSRGQRMEGSFINKSLLTLGTVIHKLSEGNPAHIPFRDSKLTRLLQNSLSGSGAYVAIVCNVTPASAQAEETHNTLKFASRAKLVRIAVSKNEVVDDKLMLQQYEREIAELRARLELLATQQVEPLGTDTALQSSEHTANVAALNHASMLSQQEIYALRWRLEAVQRTAAQLARDKQSLEARVSRITSLLIASSRSESSRADGSSRQQRRRRTGPQRSYSSEQLRTPPQRSAQGSADGEPGGLQLRNPSWSEMCPDAACTVAVSASGKETPAEGTFLKRLPSSSTLKSFPIPGLSPNGSPARSRTPSLNVPLPIFAPSGPRLSAVDEGGMESHSFVAAATATAGAAAVEELRQHVRVLAEELQERMREVDELRLSGGSSNGAMRATSDDREVELQVLYADREVLHDQLKATTQDLEAAQEELSTLRQLNDRLVGGGEHLRSRNEQLTEELQQLKVVASANGGATHSSGALDRCKADRTGSGGLGAGALNSKIGGAGHRVDEAPTTPTVAAIAKAAVTGGAAVPCNGVSNGLSNGHVTASRSSSNASAASTSSSPRHGAGNSRIPSASGIPSLSRIPSPFAASGGNNPEVAAAGGSSSSARRTSRPHAESPRSPRPDPEDSGSSVHSIQAPYHRLATATSSIPRFDPTRAAGGSSDADAASPRAGASKVQLLHDQMRAAVDEASSREQQLREEKRTVERLRVLEARKERKLREVEGENDRLRQELGRLESVNNQLLGESVDGLSNPDLALLIQNLSAALDKAKTAAALRSITGASSAVV